jgi:hypothetical protein
MPHSVIELEVDEEAARLFREATPEERGTYAILLSSVIKRPLERRETAILPGEVMDEISRNAEARGVTPEIREDLLRD